MLSFLFCSEFNLTESIEHDIFSLCQTLNIFKSTYILITNLSHWTNATYRTVSYKTKPKQNSPRTYLNLDDDMTDLLAIFWIKNPS